MPDRSHREVSEVGELAAKIFDRMEEDHPGCRVVDALLLVEIDEEPDEDSQEKLTVVLREGTSHRGTVDRGIIDFAARFLYGMRDEEEPEDEEDED